MYKLLIIIGLLLLSSQTNAQGLTLTYRLDQPKKPGNIEVKVYRGDVVISGYQGDNVIVNLQNKKTKPNANGLRKMFVKPSDLKISQKNNKVNIHKPLSNDVLVYQIKVPTKFRIKINIIERGNIQVKDIQGVVEANSFHGNIILKNIQGTAVVNVMEIGNIEAEFVNTAFDKPMMFTTFKGDISLKVPPKAKARLELKSDFGEFFTDFPKTLLRYDPQLTASSPWNYYILNHGKSKVTLKNIEGNIYLRQKK